MPERQSSPGEVAARPETDTADDGGSAGTPPDRPRPENRSAGAEEVLLFEDAASRRARLAGPDGDPDVTAVTMMIPTRGPASREDGPSPLPDVATPVDPPVGAADGEPSDTVAVPAAAARSGGAGSGAAASPLPGSEPAGGDRPRPRPRTASPTTPEQSPTVLTPVAGPDAGHTRERGGSARNGHEEHRPQPDGTQQNGSGPDTAHGTARTTATLDGAALDGAALDGAVPDPTHRNGTAPAHGTANGSPPGVTDRGRPEQDGPADDEPAQNGVAQNELAQNEPAPADGPAAPARPASEPELVGLDGPTVVVPAVVPAVAPSSPTGAATAPARDEPAGSSDAATDAEATKMLSAPDADADADTDIDADIDTAPPAPDDAPTELLPVSPAPPTRPAGSGSAPTGRPPYRRPLLVAAGVLGVLALLYGGDLLLSNGSVPRGVVVAGVPVGGLAIDAAERQLRSEIDPRTVRPVAVTAGEARSEIDPAAAGLSVDWAGTMERAGSQPLNPVTRVLSFFTDRDVPIATAADRDAMGAAIAALAPSVDRPAVEGSVRFEGTTPVPVDPVPGRQLDQPAAAEMLQRDWATGNPVALPLTTLPPLTTADDVADAIEKVARPAVSAPVVVNGEGGVSATLTPQAIATVLTFRADPGGDLVPEINVQGVTDALEPQLAPSETPGRDASLDFSTGQPVITPSRDGRGVDFEATLKDLVTVLTGTGDRQLTAVYGDQPAELTTEKLKALGITGVIGEFTTRGFALDSGRNIKRAAEVINGMVVAPGKTFSLNGATEPRDAAHGYAEAGIINDGHASRGVGGGVSQIATTLYNAAYFAGMVDVSHQEHSFYISRYPAGREATVFEGAIDMKFRNDNPTGVMIQTAWTPDSITVRLFGTKRYEVTSTPGPRTKPTEPSKVSIADGEPCSPSQGAPGFTITDTRTLREISTGQVRNETRTVRYNPAPIVECGDDD